MKEFFRNKGVLLLCCVLTLTIVVGAIAILTPRADIPDNVCRHTKYRLRGTVTENDETVYQFKCLTCRETFEAESETTEFISHKPAFADGTLVMSEPWEIGAYINTDAGREYRLAVQQGTAANGQSDWFFTAGTLWSTALGVRINSGHVGLCPGGSLGDGCITYVAEESGYVHPYLDMLKNKTVGKSAYLCVMLNGEPVLAQEDWYLFAASDDYASIVDEAEAANEQYKDLWIYVRPGDRISFAVRKYASDNGVEVALYPAVEFCAKNPSK